jgi:hypothetical protein
VKLAGSEIKSIRVIFTAFGGKLRSEPMELPDNTTDRFYLPLDMDVLVASAKMDDSMVPDAPIHKRGTFEATGYFFGTSDGEHPREYVLVDIS